MNILPDEPLWLLEDGDQRTAHGSVMEAMEWLQEAHPLLIDWRIHPVGSEGQRTIEAFDGRQVNEWTVRRV